MLYVDIEKKLSCFTLKVRFECDKLPLSLLGPSGAGKSVTLRCIAGIERPDKGRIVLDDTVLFDSEKRINLPPQKRRVGYLFQDYALFPNMTVWENIKAGMKNTPRNEREKKAEDLLRKFRLSHLRSARPATLSGGEKQRTALARIFASEPKVLLLDEPFSSLDTDLKWELEDELKLRFKDFDGDIVIVSHYIDEVLELCDHVVRIRDGASDDPVNVRDYYQTVLRSERMGRVTVSKKRIEWLDYDERSL